MRPHPAASPATRALAAALAGTTGALLLPGVVAAHQLTGRYESPIPLWAYLLGAAVAVALSFGFVLLRPASVPGTGPRRRAGHHLPRPIRTLLRALGLAGWLAVVVQGIAADDPGAADAASLVLWVYGWVGLALLSALGGPFWRWIDPFSTLHDAGAWAVRRLGIGPWRPAVYPVRLAHWPAVAGFAVFVWLELVMPGTRAGRPLVAALLLYTAWTLVMMGQYGRDAWRTHGETFSVWFLTLSRFAHFGADPDDEDGVRRQLPPDGLVWADWDVSRIVLVALATGAILFDGLSQTQAWFDAFGAPDVARETVLTAAFLGLVCLAVLVASRSVGLAALGAGLLPIAIGYLIAHYLTYLIGDGMRIIAVASDPLGQGWDLIGFREFDPSVAWLPPGLVWAVQVVAVVGGHVIGAWAGHGAAVAETVAGEPGLGAGAPVPARDVRRIRREQVPLALLMVCLTALTLWSLGQSIVKSPEQASGPASVGAVVA